MTLFVPASLIRRAATAATALALLATACAPPSSPPPDTELPVLLTTGDDLPGDGRWGNVIVSADGEVAVIESFDATFSEPAQLWRRELGSTSVVDITPAEATLVWDKTWMSPDGRFVTSRTELSDPSSHARFTVYDASTGATTSWANDDYHPAEWHAPVVSFDGSSVIVGYEEWVPFGCAVRDLATGVEVSCAEDPSDFVAFVAASLNGRFVIYDNASRGRFELLDLQTGVRVPSPLERCCIQAPSMLSDDGEVLMTTGSSGDSNPVTYVGSVHTGAVTEFPDPLWTFQFGWGLSTDGSLVAVEASKSVDGVPLNALVIWRPSTGDLVSIEGSPCAWRNQGFVLSKGAVCVRTDDALVAEDTDGEDDAYLVPIPEFG